MSGQGIIVASVIAGLSFGLYCISLISLFTRVDDRLVLTYPETFAGLADIRDIFLGSVNYSIGANPRRIDHVRFPQSPDTREEFDDLQRRNLLLNQVFNESVADAARGSLLHRLMRVSWCSSGAARVDVLPAERNAGCKCISDTYLQYIDESIPSNATMANGTVQPWALQVTVHVPHEVRQRAGDRVYRCWDQELVTRSRHCGRLCTTHVGTLCVFVNILFILVCVSFVAFRVFKWNVYLTKLMIMAFAGTLCIALLVRDADVNSLMLGGVAVSVFYLTITLHSDLSFNVEDGDAVGPHPLTSAFMLHLPLMLSAHTIQIGVSGYARDIWAFTSFGISGGLLGVVAQRLFWHSWYTALLDPKRYFQNFVARLSLNVAYVSLQVLLLLLFVAYFYFGSPYLGGSWGLFIMYQVYLTSIPWLLSKDYALMMESNGAGSARELTFLQICVMGVTLIANGVMTLVALIDLL